MLLEELAIGPQGRRFVGGEDVVAAEAESALTVVLVRDLGREEPGAELDVPHLAVVGQVVANRVPVPGQDVRLGPRGYVSGEGAGVRDPAVPDVDTRGGDVSRVEILENLRPDQDRAHRRGHGGGVVEPVCAERERAQTVQLAPEDPLVLTGEE